MISCDMSPQSYVRNKHPRFVIACANQRREGSIKKPYRYQNYTKAYAACKERCAFLSSSKLKPYNSRETYKHIPFPSACNAASHYGNKGKWARLPPAQCQTVQVFATRLLTDALDLERRKGGSSLLTSLSTSFAPVHTCLGRVRCVAPARI